jgi:hypothetical protein
MQIKLFDICRDHRGDSGAAVYASRDGELGVYAVGLFSGSRPGDASEPRDGDCGDPEDGKSKLIAVQTIAPVLALANVHLLRSDLRNQGTDIDP